MTECEFRTELTKRDLEWGQLACEAWQAWTPEERARATVEDLDADVEDALLAIGEAEETE